MQFEVFDFQTGQSLCTGTEATDGRAHKPPKGH